jgi:hypothetical protein
MTTKRKTMARIRSMMPEVRQEIIATCEQLLASGGVDLDSYGENFELPKIVLTAAMKRASGNLRPLTDHGKREVANLEKF